MPKRSRSHELEDESIVRFKSSIPKRWVCREKDRDYGVDLEVEVFDVDGNSTGLMFYVQLKATDDVEKANRTSIQVDRLRYLASLSMPSIVVRYCSPTDQMSWIWNFNALAQAKPDAETVSLKVDQEWTDTTAKDIEDVLRKLRRLKAADRDERFPLSCSYELSFGKRLIADAALSAAIDDLTFFSRNAANKSELELTISFRTDEIEISLAPIGYLRIPTTQFAAAEITEVLVFGLTAVLGRMGFHDRAATVARSALRLGVLSNFLPRELSYIGCSSLKGTPLEAARLAVNAGLHTMQDRSFAGFIEDLQTSGAPRHDITAALETFYSSAMAAAPGSSRGSILYNVGNIRANNHQYAKAVAAFNAARKARPEYSSSAYFLRELGGSLFLGGHYRCAATAYSASLDKEHDVRTVFCYADSLFFSHEFSKCAELMHSLSSTEEMTLASQARLKAALSEWLMVHEVSPSLTVEALSACVHSAIAADDVSTRYFAAQMIAFLMQSNSEAWSYSIQFSLSCCPEAEILDVMTCAFVACGVEAYSHFRDRVSALGATDDDLVDIDKLAAQAREIALAQKKHPYTIRVLHDDHVETYIRRNF